MVRGAASGPGSRPWADTRRRSRGADAGAACDQLQARMRVRVAACCHVRCAMGLTLACGVGGGGIRAVGTRADGELLREMDECEDELAVLCVDREMGPAGVHALADAIIISAAHAARVRPRALGGVGALC